MQIILTALLLLSSSHLAMADDGGIIGIKVNDVSMNQVSIDPKTYTYVKTPVASPNYEININGNEANKLMRILPPVLFVDATPKFPKFKKLWDENDRSLDITGEDDKKPSVSISCSGGEFDFEGSDINNTKFTPYSDGAHCTISVQPTVMDEDVEYTFNPVKDVCSEK